MDWTFPDCVMGDSADVAALIRMAGRVAASCSATNAQVLRATAILWQAFIDCAGENGAIMPKVADQIERM